MRALQSCAWLHESEISSMLAFGFLRFPGPEPTSRFLVPAEALVQRTERGAASMQAAGQRLGEEAGVPGACRAPTRRPEAKIAWAVVNTRLRVAWTAREGLWPSRHRVRHGLGRRQWVASSHFCF